MRLDPNGPASRPPARLRALLPVALLATVMGLGGCNRSSLSPMAYSFQSQPALPSGSQSSKLVPSPATAQPNLPRPEAEPDMLALAREIGAKGGLITDLPAMALQLGETYQTQVIPRSSQDKADRLAREWAADAQQIYVVWAYWKLPTLSVTRHAYYSPSKNKAFKVEFTLSSLFAKSFEEPADGFEQASLILNEARDRHAFGVKDAHAIAKRMGYFPSKYGAAVLLDIKTYGPMWVFAHMPSQTEGEPVMLVHAESGMVTQGGEALLLARYLFERAGY